MARRKKKQFQDSYHSMNNSYGQRATTGLTGRAWLTSIYLKRKKRVLEKLNFVEIIFSVTTVGILGLVCSLFIHVIDRITDDDYVSKKKRKLGIKK